MLLNLKDSIGHEAIKRASQKGREGFDVRSSQSARPVLSIGEAFPLKRRGLCSQSAKPHNRQTRCGESVV